MRFDSHTDLNYYLDHEYVHFLLLWSHDSPLMQCRAKALRTKTSRSLSRTKSSTFVYSTLTTASSDYGRRYLAYAFDVYLLQQDVERLRRLLVF